MYRKLIYLVSFVLVLGLVSNTNGQPTGEFLLEWWFDIGSGNAVTDLINNANYPDNPTGSAMMDSVELPRTKPASLWEGDVDNYGARLQGYIYPPATGNYTFWITGDNGSQFWLSTNFDSSNVVMTCEVPGTQWTGDREWAKFPNDQKSAPVTLEAGQKYYVDVWFKEGSGGDGVAVGWGGPGIGEGPEVISGQYISPVLGPANFIATNPSPSNSAILADTWVSLSWDPGAYTLSHNVYFGDNFDDVDASAESVFRGNQPSTYYVVGFPGFPFPDGLTIGTTYYWRIDEVNDTHPDSPWKGNIWSFTIPPKKAYGPSPADSAELVDPNVELSWEIGFGSKLHYMYFGDNFDEVNNATGGAPLGFTTYTPGPLKLAKTYYWRVDEFDIIETHKGDVWSFTTEGAVANPEPANGAVDVKQTSILTWTPGVYAASHQVYFGTDEDAVKNADTSSPEYKGTGDLGAQSYDPGKLELGATYYWRIDEVNNVNPDSPWVGPVWSFTTANFLVVDDFEDYDIGNNEIWWAWKDGLGYAAHPTLPDYPGNGTGSIVGDENTASYTEETIVHGGSQSMPLFYNNNQQLKAKYSEVELTLTYPRDWTENGINTLTIWFRGNPTGLLEEPAGTYTMTASGVDIWDQADEFRYAWKQLSGAGTISAQVLSVQNTDPWAKAGVMIRETLDPGSEFAFVCVTPGNGLRFQARLSTGSSATSDTSVVTPEQTAITAPYWVKLERDTASNFNGYYSSNGVSWQAMSWNPQRISMPPNVYIGLALTSHSSGVTCVAEFSNVQTTGTVTPMIWTHEAIGAAMTSNDAEPMYVALNGSAVVFHDNPNAALIDTWTQWNIDLQGFADQGVNLANVNTIAIGFGDKKNPQPGGSGTAYFDDIRLYRLAP